MISRIRDTPIMAVPEFHIGFPALFKPQSIVDFGQPKYCCGAFLLDGPSIRDFRRRVQEEEDKLIWDYFETGDEPIRRVLRSCAEGRVEYLRKYTHLPMSSKNKPIVKIIRGGKEYYAGESDILAGDICTAEVMLFAYVSNGRKGIGASLLSVTKVREMEVSDEQAALMADIDNVIERKAI